MQNTHIIIQARMGSNRLPGKVLMPFVGDFSFLEWIVERCKLSNVAQIVIVAITTNPLDDAIEALCKAKGYDYMRGCEHDVLDRYYEAAKFFGSDIIVRVAGDSPFVDIDEMDRSIKVLQREGLEYITTKSGGLPLGAGSETFTFEAFKRVFSEAQNQYDREHVTPYFYHHPELFKLRTLFLEDAPHPVAERVQFALDKQEDALFLKTLAGRMGISSPKARLSTNTILSFLESNPELIAINTNQK